MIELIECLNGYLFTGIIMKRLTITWNSTGIEAIRHLARNISFDEQPCTEINSEDIDFLAASELFASVSRKLTPSISKTLGLIVSQGGKGIPTFGAVLVFGKNRHRLFPDVVIRCARFQGIDTHRFLDYMEIGEHRYNA
ncbi:hypothetical protein PITCH_A580016 [uncultured Desulfobacterium sp.]|uniref:Uncharacterized protein n=1 Tax=uncultured Desulfobacterium sp. TaxID=201089 RepID=A0A445N158_9BACT|nr:hypothetical protein PITCH_A580016 [uncultured Desulfobacterium sp.]